MLNNCQFISGCFTLLFSSIPNVHILLQGLEISGKVGDARQSTKISKQKIWAISHNIHLKMFNYEKFTMI